MRVSPSPNKERRGGRAQPAPTPPRSKFLCRCWGGSGVVGGRAGRKAKPGPPTRPQPPQRHRRGAHELCQSVLCRQSELYQDATTKRTTDVPIFSQRRNASITNMSNNYRHNRQLPMSQRGENEIMHQEMRDREKIIAEQCMDMVRTPQKKFTEPRTVEADITIHVATHMKDNPGPGAYAMCVDDGTPEDPYCHWEAHTTGPHLELIALNAALQRVASLNGSAVIHTTTANTAKYLHDGTAARWKAKGGHKADGDRVKHWELWEPVLAHYETRDLTIVYQTCNATAAMRRCADVAERPFQPRTRIGGSRHR